MTDTILPSYTSLDRFFIKGRGWCYVVKLDQETNDFDFLMAKC